MGAKEGVRRTIRLGNELNLGSSEKERSPCGVAKKEK